jgi:MOSC domain-containing protein YiiM
MQATSLQDLELGLAEVRAAPRKHGTVELIVRRPAEEEREVLEEAQLDLVEGLVGDRWAAGKGHPDTQLTMMSARAAALVAGPRARWALAGDQLYIDLDIGYDNLPPGTLLRVGEAVIEITPAPHTGCGKFLRRFGVEAQKLVNSPTGRELNLRGINARVVTAGTVKRGDTIAKLLGEAGG